MKCNIFQQSRIVYMVLMFVCFIVFSQNQPPPMASTVKAPTEKPIKLANGDIKLGHIILDRKNNEISFFAKINSPSTSQMEVLICGVRGRDHESVFITDASPFQIQLMLYLLGAKDDVKRQQKYKKGSLIQIDVEWVDAKGEKKREPVESWVLDLRTKKPMKRRGWFFSGSNFIDGVYQAEGTGNIALLYTDREDSVLDNADPESLSDTIFGMNLQKFKPNPNSEVKMIMSLKKEN